MALSRRLLVSPGALSSAFAFESWVWLTDDAAEAEEEQQRRSDGTSDSDGASDAVAQTAADAERFACRAVHAFPRCATAWAMTGLALWRRLHQGSVAPSTAVSRLRTAQVCRFSAGIPFWKAVSRQ